MPTRILSRPPEVSFLHRNVQPPTNLYIHRDDVLIARVANAVTSAELAVEARVMDPQGTIRPVRERVAPTDDRVQATSVFAMNEGFLLGLTVHSTGATIRRGQCFVEMSIGRGSPTSFSLAQLLTSDYVSDNGQMGWPGGRIISSIEGPGHIRRIAATVPSAGSVINEAVPTGARWKLHSITYLYTADNTGSPRTHGVTLNDDSSNFIWHVSDQSTQAINTAHRINIGPAGFWQTFAATEHVIPTPPEVPLLQGFVIQNLVTAFSLGDAYSQVSLWVEEWIET